MPDQTAFVAMKFDGNAASDRRYTLFKRVLADAGFETVRADEIPTSGPVVDEVCALLRSAAFVLIDSTGDSHSVSYEIGYCHGVGRAVESTLLLREGSQIPFNYRHFRHRCYSNLKELEASLREHFGLFPPLRNRQFGYVFTVDVPHDHQGFEAAVVQATFDSLENYEVDGRCDYYDHDGYIRSESLGPAIHSVTLSRVPNATAPRLFRVGLGLGVNTKKGFPDFDWWSDFSRYFSHALSSRDVKLRHDEILSEMTAFENIRRELIFRGTAHLHRGKVKRMAWTKDANVFQTEAASRLMAAEMASDWKR